MSVTVKTVSKRWDEFYAMAMSICHNEELSGDLVQLMFVKLIDIERKEGNLKRITYKDEVNTYFCYRILFTLFLDYTRQKNRHDKLFTSIEDLANPIEAEYDPNEALTAEEEYYETQQELIEEVEDTDLHWYDAQLLKEYGMSDKSLRQLAKETGISTMSIYNTIKNARQQIQEKARQTKITAYREAKARRDNKE